MSLTKCNNNPDHTNSQNEDENVFKWWLFYYNARIIFYSMFVEQKLSKTDLFKIDGTFKVIIFSYDYL